MKARQPKGKSLIDAFQNGRVQIDSPSLGCMHSRCERKTLFLTGCSPALLLVRVHSKFFRTMKSMWFGIGIADNFIGIQYLVLYEIGSIFGIAQALADESVLSFQRCHMLIKCH